MSELTKIQSTFVRYLVRDQLNPTEAARLAGYAHPKQRAYELLSKPNVQAAVRQQQARLIDGHLGNVALKTLENVMMSETVPASARVAAARAVLEAGGYFRRDPREELENKSMEEMSQEELKTFVSNGRQKLFTMLNAQGHA